MPTTLVEHRTNERDRQQQILDGARVQLAAAKVAVDVHGATAAARADELGTLDAEIEGHRRDLAESTTPVEMNTLAQLIADKTRQRQVVLRQWLDARALLGEQDALQVHFQAMVDSATTRHANAVIALATAVEEQQEVVAWIDAANAAPVSGVPAAAAAVLAGAAFSGANDAFGAAVLPPKLRELAEARFNRQNVVVEAAALVAAASEVASTTLANAAGSVAEQASGLGRDYDLTRSILRDFVGRSQTRLAQAEAVLAATTAEPVLSPEQIAALSDASTLGARDSAADLAIDFENAQVAVDKAQGDRDAAVQFLRLQSPLADDATLDADPAVAGEVAALVAAKSALSTAAGNYTLVASQTVTLWQAEVPSDAWRRFVQFLEAKRDLEALQATNLDDTDAASLQSRLRTAEGAWGDALEAQAFYARGQHYAETRQVLEEARRQQVVSDYVARLNNQLAGNES